jgi:hypothetical protein
MHTEVGNLLGKAFQQQWSTYTHTQEHACNMLFEVCFHKEKTFIHHGSVMQAYAAPSTALHRVWLSTCNGYVMHSISTPVPRAPEQQLAPTFPPDLNERMHDP